MRALAALLLAACTAACAGKGRSAAADEPDGGAYGALDSAVSATGDGATKQVGLSLALTADKVTLCPGECTDLRALPDGNRSELVYAWDDDLTGTGDMQHVCPDKTTSYGVSATESAGTAEFGAQNATAKLTVTVDECKPDPRKSCELRQRFETPYGGNYLSNNGKPWVTVTSWGDSAISATSDGGAVVMGTFGGRVRLGSEELRTEGRAGVFVLRVDADCQPVWSRSLSPTVPTDAHFGMAHALDKQGNIYIVSGGGPLIDFNPLLAYPFGFTTELLVTKLSPTGQQLYRVRFPVTATAFVMSVTSDGEDNLYIAGAAHSYTDLGDGPIGLSPTALRSFLLVLDPEGKRKKLQLELGVTSVAATSEQVVLGRSSYAELDFLSTFAGVYPPFTASVESLNPGDLSSRWSRAEYWPFDLLSTGGVAYITMGASEMTSASGTTLVNTIDLVRTDAQGRDVTRGELSRQEYTVDGDGGAVAVDAGMGEPEETLLNPPQQLRRGPNDQIAFATHLFRDVNIQGQRVVFRGELPTETNPYFKQDLLVAKVDADDRVMWIYQPDWGSDPWFAGLDFDSSANVWVAGQGNVAGSDNGTARELDFVISKLRGTR